MQREVTWSDIVGSPPGDKSRAVYDKDRDKRPKGSGGGGLGGKSWSTKSIIHFNLLATSSQQFIDNL